MNINQLKNDIFNADDPQKQLKAAYMMRWVKNNNEILHILFRACYEAKSPALQQEAVKSLGILSPDKALESFKLYAQRSDSNMRMRVYYHIGTLGDPKGMDVLLRGLNDSDDKARRAAIISCGRLGKDHGIITSLRKLLNPFESEFIKSAVKISIDKINRRMNNGHNVYDRQTFDNPAEKKSNNKSFNNNNQSVKKSNSYVPKGF